MGSKYTGSSLFKMQLFIIIAGVICTYLLIGFSMWLRLMSAYPPSGKQVWRDAIALLILMMLFWPLILQYTIKEVDKATKEADREISKFKDDK